MINLKLLSFCFSFGSIYGTHSRGSTEMYVFLDDIVLLGESEEVLNGWLET